MGIELGKLNDLISAIEEGDCQRVKTALDTSKINGHKESSIINLKNRDKKTPLHIALDQPNPDSKIIRLLIEGAAHSNIQDSKGETLLCLVVGNLTLWSLLSKEDRGLLVEKSDICYRYSEPLNDKKKKVNKDGDNYLHIAARTGNINAFMYIFKKSVEKNVRLLEYNADHENPFHLAARMGILPAVVKGMFEHLELTGSNGIKRLENSIKKAKEAKSDAKEFQKELREVKKKLKNDKDYVVEALRSKCALNEKKRTPLDCISKTEKEDIKKTAGINDKLICNKNFHLCLYVVGAIVSIAALCLSLYLLFLTSETFALSSMASMAFGGVTYLSLKACSEIHDLYSEDASMKDLAITQISGDNLAV